MAAPQRERRYEPAGPWRSDREFAGKASGRRKKGAKKSPVAAFAALAIVPVLLMLGSVYAHAAAAGLEGETARLTDEKVRAEAEAERFEVKIAELSGPERIRSTAERDLGMKDPEGKDLRTFDGSDGEDAARDVEGER